MQNFHIYRDGERDKMANIKMKARNLVKEKMVKLDHSVGYFFTEFGR